MLTQSFETVPKKGWQCGYVDLDSFTAVDVVPPLKCVAGEAGAPSAACLAALEASGCPHGKGVRGCQKCLGCHTGGCAGSNGSKVGCTDEGIGHWCQA